MNFLLFVYTLPGTLQLHYYIMVNQILNAGCFNYFLLNCDCLSGLLITNETYSSTPAPHCFLVPP